MAAPHRAGQAILRWGFNALVPAVLLTVALFTLWTFATPHLPLLREAALEGLLVAPRLLIAVTAVHLLDRWASHAYVQSLRLGRAHIGTRPFLAPFAAKRITAHEVTEQWQSIAYGREGRVDRFVGAGLDQAVARIDEELSTSAPDGRRLTETLEMLGLALGSATSLTSLAGSLRSAIEALLS